ncbi:hypothetical protein [Methylobacterium sp. E-066]|uniref:hypothetical protein n=1 Tax=Methylobacterium sp. E-066 TaxID=2836584 RepID=UPI001FB89CA5|nr:hypothetical protein [Methylobacterium sp. E-066]MCJ2141549.1 hypothetical protein [Methylobacterium sp. E-066]
MQGDEFRKLLRALDRTQVAFASEIGVSLRTVHTWASSGPPGEIVYLLDLLTRQEQPLGTAGTAGGEFRRAVEAELGRLSADAGRRNLEAEFLNLVGRWLERRRSAISTSSSLPPEEAGHPDSD